MRHLLCVISWDISHLVFVNISFYIQWNLRREDTMGMGILSSLWRLSSFRGSCFAHAQGRLLLLGLCLSVRPENAVTYSAVDEDQVICLKRLHSRVMQRNTSEKAIANYSDLPAVSFLRLTHSEAPEGTQRFSTAFSLAEKRYLLIPLAPVGGRTNRRYNSYKTRGVANFRARALA